MSKISNIILGKTGEGIAVAHVRKLGYRILARNYRRRFGEIDIIAKDGDTLVFIEVKTRKTQNYGTPFEALTLHKQQQISKVALDYMTQKKVENCNIRFDVVAVLMDKEGRQTVEVLPNAFDAVEW